MTTLQFQMNEPIAKASKHAMKIGTHNGTFHCDEAFACYMLKLLPEYSDAEVIRTRDQAKLDECDVVVDVGGEFCHEKHRYDHHMRTFTYGFNSLVRSKPWTTKLSSAGLIYLHYGEKIIKLIMEENAKLKEADPVIDDAVHLIYDKVYENFVEEIDAVDNGIEQSDDKERYRITSTLSKRVGALNPRWNESGVDVDERFQKAMELIGSEFRDKVDYYQLGWLPARKIVKDAVKRRFEVHSSGEIICFNEGSCPWKEHLMDIEKDLELSTPIKYVLFEDSNSNWRVQCVPEKPTGFSNRLSLPEAWRGVRDDELSKLSGIEDCIFVHSSGFIGGNKTYKGALKMATDSLIIAGQ